MTDTNEPTDDGLPWGHIEDGVWYELPRSPGLLYLGPPPFDVTLWDGRVRRVVHNPASHEGVIRQGTT
jgi:hypothetical protein